MTGEPKSQYLRGLAKVFNPPFLEALDASLAKRPASGEGEPEKRWANDLVGVLLGMDASGGKLASAGPGALPNSSHATKKVR